MQPEPPALLVERVERPGFDLADAFAAHVEQPAELNQAVRATVGDVQRARVLELGEVLPRVALPDVTGGLADVQRKVMATRHERTRARPVLAFAAGLRLRVHREQLLVGRLTVLGRFVRRSRTSLWPALACVARSSSRTRSELGNASVPGSHRDHRTRALCLSSRGWLVALRQAMSIDTTLT